ncbi:MAG: lycopene cyclase family protein, partial [Allosphingosinicella sp.]
PDAVRTALLVARSPDFSGEKLARLLRGAAERLWRERAYYRLLNRMLFRAAPPADRYRVLEHFYRLDAGLIGRFYAARLTPWDKIRILSGKPPVPIGRALAAMWN